MNYYYRNTISKFLDASVNEIIGSMTRSNEFDATLLQNKSWELQIPILKKALHRFSGEVFFEFSIPRMGKRVDTLVIINSVVWDGDLRYSINGWQTYSFRGKKWQNINKVERKIYLLNAYRVLLTRARQGMVIVIPEGTDEDHTRKKEYYDPTFNYLKNIGISII